MANRHGISVFLCFFLGLFPGEALHGFDQPVMQKIIRENEQLWHQAIDGIQAGSSRARAEQIQGQKFGVGLGVCLVLETISSH